MEQKSLRVLDTNKTFFSKITNSITKILIPTKVSFNSMIISIKRNSVIKNYYNYKIETNDEKKDLLMQKYEEAYVLYLEAIDKYVLDSLYKKVKNNTATSFEKSALSKYYTIVSLKEKQYLEYKYKKQEYLLNIDYASVNSLKKENAIEKYNDFYSSKMDVLYKGLLKNYSVQLAGNKNEENIVYNKIFTTLENYVLEILPIKIKLSKENELVSIIKKHEEYEQVSIGKLDEIDKIKQKMILLNLGRQLFTHSLPPVVAEQCYIYLIKNNKELILKATNKTKSVRAYNMIIELIDNYNYELLSTKIYWDKPEERDEYKKFYEKYKEISKFSKERQLKQKEIMFARGYMKRLCSNKEDNNKFIKILKERLVELGDMRQIRNTYKTEGNYSKKK